MSLPPHIPTGNYPASAPVHVLDLELAADQMIAKMQGRRRHTETLAREAGTSVVMMAMEAGDVIKEHTAPSAVSVHLFRGIIELNAGGQSHVLRAGQLAFLQPKVPHDLAAKEQSVVILTLSEA